MDERRRLNYGDRKVIEERLDSGWKLADIADELECDPYASWQKPHIENAHTLLRRVLPKGSSFDGLTQDDVNLVCSQINSYPREELGWRSPFETLPAWGQENLPLAFGMRIIPRDEVNLTPSLIGRQNQRAARPDAKGRVNPRPAVGASKSRVPRALGECALEEGANAATP